jgi:hypothetical protein
MNCNLPAERPSAYVYADNRAVVICNGLRAVLFNRVQGRWLRDALEVLAEEERATRMQQNHVFGGFMDGSGEVVLFGGTQDDLVSVRISSTAFAQLRSELENG